METLGYFNTTNQNAEFVLAETRNCKSQGKIILKFFRKYGKLSASEVLDMYPTKILLTSVRRSISNLKFDGYLSKLDETRIGLYKKPEHFFKLKTAQLILI